MVCVYEKQKQCIRIIPNVNNFISTTFQNVYRNEIFVGYKHDLTFFLCHAIVCFKYLSFYL